MIDVYVYFFPSCLYVQSKKETNKQRKQERKEERRKHDTRPPFSHFDPTHSLSFLLLMPLLLLPLPLEPHLLHLLVDALQVPR